MEELGELGRGRRKTGGGANAVLTQPHVPFVLNKRNPTGPMMHGCSISIARACVFHGEAV
jgi:hypothetical protein